MSISVSEFTSKLSNLVEALPLEEGYSSSHLIRRFQDHFGQDPIKLPGVVTEYFRYQHLCIQAAIEHYIAKDNRSAELIGTTHRRISDMLDSDTTCYRSPMEAPVQYVTIDLGEERTTTAVEKGLYLVCDGDNRLAIGLFSRHREISLEVMAPELAIAEQFLAELRILIDQHSIYRGQILEVGESFEMIPKLLNLDLIPQDSVVLPDGLLDRIEEHAVNFSKHRQMIAAAGLSQKRVLLLYGAPDTGKMLVVKYLLGKMQQRTTVLVRGDGMRWIDEVCTLARSLQPVTVVVDNLERSSSDNLFNQIKGFSDDADVLFLITCTIENLKHVFEFSPYCIQHSFEIPLPDDNCRRQLLELYSRKFDVEANMQTLVAQTKSANPVFIRELVTTAAIFAAEDGSRIRLRDGHFDAALRELTGGAARLNVETQCPCLR